MIAKPFVKWAGGKGSLLPQLKAHYPQEFTNPTFELETYVEPFLGGGAVLIDMLNTQTVKKAFAYDINEDLINTYKTIKDNVEELIEILDLYQDAYNGKPLEMQKAFYSKKRDEFNSKKTSVVTRSALFIFLNKTCFNGLFRVNSKNEFNVPMGRYKNPTICDSANLRELSNLFNKNNVEFICGSYKDAFKHMNKNTFVYFDPPYRPLTQSGFTSYTKDDFNDEDQKALSLFYQDASNTGAKLMLSNSNPKNTNKDDKFFEELYKTFKINEVMAARSINSKGNSRGKISELLITNYEK